MAFKDKVIKIAYELKDKFSGQVSRVTGSFKKIGRASDKSSQKITRNNKRAGNSFGFLLSRITPVKTAILAFGAAVVGIAISIKKWTDAANKQERAETKLATSLRNLTGASQEQIDALTKQASALQQITGYGDEATISAQAMLATFKLTAEQIGQLTPGLLDMAESARKAGKAEVDLESISIALGKAFTSGIGSLSRYGIAMSGAQKEAFKMADQQEKVSVLAAILKDNFGGLAEAVGKTYEGAVRKADAAQGDFLETLGRLFTKSEAWIKLTVTVSETWQSLSTGIGGSAKEIGIVVSGMARIIVGAAGVIKFTWNSLQVVFKSVAIAFVDMASSINYAASLITFGDLSKALKNAANAAKRYANELRQGLVDDFEDMAEANKMFSEALFGVEKSAEKTKKKIVELTEATEDAATATEDAAEATEAAAKENKTATRSYESLSRSIDKTALAHDKSTNALKRAREEADEAKKNFSDLVDEMTGTEKTVGILDIFAKIAEASKQMKEGAGDGALKTAEEAAEMLRDIKEAGTETDATLVSVALRLEALGAKAAEMSTQDELIDAEKSKAALDELIAKKQKLVEGPIQMIVAVDSTALDALKQTKEIVIPVRYKVVGGIPAFGDGTAHIMADAARKIGDK